MATVWKAWNAETTPPIIGSATAWSRWIDEYERHQTIATVPRSTNPQDVWIRWCGTSRTPPRPDPNRRAESLLESVLTDEQYQSHRRHRHFFMRGSAGNRYRIDTHKSQHNVHLVDDQGNIRRTYCAVPLVRVPLADSVLTQLLKLQTDEPGFVGIANAS